MAKELSPDQALRLARIAELEAHYDMLWQSKAVKTPERKKVLDAAWAKAAAERAAYLEEYQHVPFLQGTLVPLDECGNLNLAGLQTAKEWCQALLAVYRQLGQRDVPVANVIQKAMACREKLESPSAPQAARTFEAELALRKSWVGEDQGAHEGTTNPAAPGPAAIIALESLLRFLDRPPGGAASHE
jgi:hypothetical protein